MTVGGRSLRSYLLLPRPKDAVKWWIFPATFALGLASAGEADAKQVARAAVVWAALELLIYQARYQWNDVRGFAADRRHPDAADRGRLPLAPGGPRTSVVSSSAVAVLRLVLAAALALAVPSLNLGEPLLFLTLAVFGIAAVYEALRSRSTGMTGKVPPDLRPAIAGLWVAVGGGYAARGVGGLALAIDLGSRPALAAAAVVTMWSFGIAFVTSRWTLEALAFARVDGDRLRWSADPGQAREHTLALARWLPRRVVPLPGGGRPTTWHALRGRTQMTAPWNLAAVLSGAGAGATGRLLAAPSEPVVVGLAALSGALLALGVLVAPRARLAAWAVACAVLALGTAAAGSPDPLLAAVPWAAIIGAHLLFTAQSLDTLAHPLRYALGRAAAALTPLARSHGEAR